MKVNKLVWIIGMVLISFVYAQELQPGRLTINNVEIPYIVPSRAVAQEKSLERVTPPGGKSPGSPPITNDDKLLLSCVKNKNLNDCKSISILGVKNLGFANYATQNIDNTACDEIDNSGLKELCQARVASLKKVSDVSCEVEFGSCFGERFCGNDNLLENSGFEFSRTGKTAKATGISCSLDGIPNAELKTCGKDIGYTSSIDKYKSHNSIYYCNGNEFVYKESCSSNCYKQGNDASCVVPKEKTCEKKRKMIENCYCEGARGQLSWCADFCGDWNFNDYSNNYDCVHLRDEYNEPTGYADFYCYQQYSTGCNLVSECKSDEMEISSVDCGISENCGDGKVDLGEECDYAKANAIRDCEESEFPKKEGINRYCSTSCYCRGEIGESVEPE